jgi:hypothetical protein
VTARSDLVTVGDGVRDSRHARNGGPKQKRAGAGRAAGRHAQRFVDTAASSP